MSSGQALPSGTVTFLFTDIEGSTRLVKALGDRYEEVLAEHQGIMRAAFAEHHGHEVDTQGDSFFVAFRRARDAINCAVAAQRELAAADWPDGAAVKVRMGIHTGEPVVGEQRYTGMGVHRAARIGAVGHGGQILLSNATRELIEDDLPSGIELRDLGRHRLKDIQRPERIYQVAAEGLPWKFPPLKSAGAVGRARHPSKKGALAVALVAAAAIAAVVVLVTRGGTETAEASTVAANSVGIIDPDKGTISSQVTVGSAPSGVASGEEAVWVTNTEANSVSRIDPETNTVRQEITVGGGPTGIAVCRGAVWVANGLDGTVTRIDPATNTPSKPIQVGAGPSAVACGEGAVWAANSSDGTVSRIDPSSWRVTKEFPVAVDPSAVAVGFGRVWVASQSTGTVVALDPHTGALESPISVGNDPDALAAGAGAVWVANRSDGTVMRIEPGSRSVTKTISVGRRPVAVAASPRAVWVSNSGDGTLNRLDPARDAVVVDTVTLGNPPRGIALDEKGLYAAVRSTGLAHRGGTLRALGNGFVDTLTLDPALSYDWQVTSATHDGLVGFRRVGGVQGLEVVPDLAESVPTPTDDGRTYTFVVRRGVRYSDGRPVEAADFRHAFERVFRLRSFAAPFYDSIVGAKECLAKPGSCDLSQSIVTEPSSRTVTFHLTEPDGEFLNKLALPFASSVPSDTPFRDLRTRAVPGTGPYRVASVVMKKNVVVDEKTHKKTVTPFISTVTLRRNPVFREWSPDAQPQGFPDAIVLGAEPDLAKRAGAVERNKADIAGDLAFTTENDRLADLAAHYPGRLKSATRPLTSYMVMNTRKPPFDDVRVRQAVNLAVDRDEVARRMGELARAPTCRVLPPNSRAYRPACPYRGGVEGARRLVAQSGTRGQRVDVWVPAGLADTLGRYFVSLLDDLGYRAGVKAIPGDYYGALAGSVDRFQIAFSGWIPDYQSPSRFLVDLFSCANVAAKPGDPGVNYAKLCDREVDRQLEAALALQTRNPAAATAAWQRAENTILDRAPVAPLYNNRDISLVSSRLGNYQFNPQFGVLFDQAWVK